MPGTAAFRHVIGDARFEQRREAQREVHRTKARGEAFRERIGWQRQHVAERVGALAGVAATGVVHAVDDEAKRGHVRGRNFGRVAELCRVGARMIDRERGDRPHRQACRHFAIVRGNQGVAIGHAPGPVARGQHAPQVDLQVGAGLAAHLVGHAGNLAFAIEQEAEYAVVHAIGIALDQRERQRGARVVAVGAFLPDPPGLEHVFPLWMAVVDQAALRRYQHIAVGDEREVERRQVLQDLRCALRRGVVITQDVHRAERRLALEDQASFEGMARRERAGRRRELGHRQRCGETFAAGEPVTVESAISGQGARRQQDSEQRHAADRPRAHWTLTPSAISASRSVASSAA